MGDIRSGDVFRPIARERKDLMDYSGAPAARRVAKRSPILIWKEKETHQGIHNIRIPRRPWDESLLNMNARLMRGPSLGNKRNMRKITAWGPENQKSIESCKSLESVSDLQVTGIP